VSRCTDGQKLLGWVDEKGYKDGGAEPRLAYHYITAYYFAVMTMTTVRSPAPAPASPGWTFSVYLYGRRRACGQYM
jgi:hypothetical protein